MGRAAGSGNAGWIEAAASAPRAFKPLENKSYGPGSCSGGAGDQSELEAEPPLVLLVEAGVLELSLVVLLLGVELDGDFF